MIGSEDLSNIVMEMEGANCFARNFSIFSFCAELQRLRLHGSSHQCSDGWLTDYT